MLPRGFHLLIATQFLSALADNALLIVAIARLQEVGAPAWWAPLLKFFFIVAYVVLAPAIGALADAWPKARLMMVANAIKFGGALALAAGCPPLAAYAVAGLGASMYAPAKYGLVTEMVPPLQLVRANAWIEVSVVVAVLFGTALGGALISQTVLHSAPAQALNAWAQGASVGGGSGLVASFAVVVAIYVLSSVLNIAVRESGARYARSSPHPLALARDFWQAQRTLWRDPHGGRLSLAATTLFWGAGAVLQFAVLRWAVDRLGLTLSEAAYLQATVALGVVAGAWFAGRHLALARATRVLPAGVLLGATVALGALVDSVTMAWPVMAAVGMIGGLLVVPMNALLQHRGHVLLSAGRSIAVQGFNENASVLAMLALYALVVRAGVAIVPLMVGFGVLLALAMGMLAWRARHVRLGGAAEQASTFGHEAGAAQKA